MNQKILAPLMLVFVMSACVSNGQNNYSWKDVGHQTVVEFGRVVSVRSVDITGKNTGVGATGGGITGAAIGSTGNGSGVLAGAAVGAIAGAVTEQVIANRQGTEYTIALRNKKVITIVQEIHDGDEIFKPGARVIVQSKGDYQRVLSADALPADIKRANGIKQINDAGNDDEAMDPSQHHHVNIKLDADTDDEDSDSNAATATHNNKGN